MKKVTAFIGTARKKHTYNAVCQFLDHLQSLGDVECEIVALSDYHLGTCRGCKQCFAKGEASCPLKDDRDVLIEKMMASDGVVFATPNYVFHVSGIMKVFLERLGFICHRPRFFGKTFTSIVAQGIGGGDEIVSYPDLVGNVMGFNTVKGSCLTALEPMTEQEKLKIDRALAKHSQRFYKRLVKSEYPVPSLFKFMGFRMARTGMRLELDDTNYDYRYYKDKGWFESDYYYPVRLGVLKKAVGSLFDWVQVRRTRNRKHGSALSL
ncbi:flavodoxin family protein [Leptolyngbya cf. ectocarpi LEGE 11479]|uniref:Flavodoxin family protein n=2 Tax=Leptolyngbya ectocarpi TaxID=1202 RepID=A0A928ZTY3_LEPEC|nr:flavodoxin family protein [Leptolyngbya cf. ectocarpi LEGE 11479]